MQKRVDEPGKVTLSPRRSGFSMFWRAFSRNRLALLGTAIILMMIALAVSAPVLAPHDPDLPHLVDKLQPPSAKYWMGTDQFGRDMLSRVMFGARVSLVVGALATGVACMVGVILGGIAGFFGKWLDESIMRSMDIVLAFPTIVLAIALVILLGTSMVNLVLVIGILRVPEFARVLRARVISLKEEDFVQAARAAGATSSRILFRHILPNAMGPILVLASLSIATAISSESALSFLGVGIQPPQSSWGTLLADGRRYLLNAIWISTFPGLALSLTIFGYNLMGDGLRDALDPRTRKGP